MALLDHLASPEPFLQRFSLGALLDQEQYLSEQYQIYRNDTVLQFTLEQMHNPYSIEDYYSTGSDFLSQKIAFKYRLRPRFQRTNYIS